MRASAPVLVQAVEKNVEHGNFAQGRAVESLLPVGGAAVDGALVIAVLRVLRVLVVPGDAAQEGGALLFALGVV